MGIARRGLDKLLGAGGKAVIGMMYKEVAFPDQGKDFTWARLAIQPGKADWRMWHPRFKFQMGHIDISQRKEIIKPQQAADRIDIDWLQAQLITQDCLHIFRHIVSYFQAHHRGKAPFAQLFADHVEQIFGLILIALHIGVACHPEGMGGNNFHAFKERL